MHGSPGDGRAYLADRFGIEELPGVLVERSGDLWLTSRAAADTDLGAESTGFRCLRVMRTRYKPTTHALQALDDRITENRAVLDRDDLLRLLDGASLDTDLPHGYVALVYDGRVVGCGEVQGGMLSSRIASGRAEELAAFLAAPG